MKRIISITAVLLLLTGCSSQSASTQDKLQVITTYYPYQLATEQIGENFIDVSSIYPEDSDAHSYELTPKQSIELQDADLVIITNPDEDNKIYNLLEDKDNLLVLNPEDNHLDQDEEEHAHSHAWLSPAQMSEDVQTIADRLINLDVTNKLVYQSNVSSLKSSLATISDQYQAFGTEQTKPIVATHDAYEALTDDYGIEFVTLYGQHHDDEPTTKEILDVVDLIKADSIKTIFVEQDDTANKVMRQIADETSANVDTIFTLETKSSLKSFDSITDFYEYNLEMMKSGQN